MPNHPDNRKVWNLDKATLDLAWLAYHEGGRRVPFGQWFLASYYIPGIIEWPSLANEPDNEMAYAMLENFVMAHGWRT